MFNISNFCFESKGCPGMPDFYEGENNSVACLVGILRNTSYKSLDLHMQIFMAIHSVKNKGF